MPPRGKKAKKKAGNKATPKARAKSSTKASRPKKTAPKKAAPKVKLVDWYPIPFKPIFKKKIWGGPGLAKLLKKKCTHQTGESWELAQYEDDVSVVKDGLFRNKTLTDILELHRKEILGNEHYMRFHDRFPILVKFLTAQDRLSLQVHPSDDFAHRYEVHGRGKMEAWYILHAPKEGRVIRGVLPGTTIAEFREHLAAGTVEKCLNVMEVEQGDVIFIPPGTIHAAFGGLVFLEVQQSSDTTYRLTDWGRKDFNGRSRKLEVEKAMNVTDFYSMGVSKFKPFRIAEYSYKRKLLIKCEKFTMESLELKNKRIKENSDPDRFQVMTVVQGSGKFYYGHKKKKSIPFRLGDTFLIPACLGAYDISARGAVELVCTFVA